MLKYICSLKGENKMLSDPNVKKIVPKVGNRYEAALAIAKRARDIETRRVIEEDPDIKDAVDIAANEIVEGKVVVKIKNKEEANEEANEENKK